MCRPKISTNRLAGSQRDRPAAIRVAAPRWGWVTTRSGRNAIRAEVKREDGSIAGEGSCVAADDGKTMTATTSGFDSQLRRFEMRTVWDRA
jgi:hypothetical protein